MALLLFISFVVHVPEEAKAFQERVFLLQENLAKFHYPEWTKRLNQKIGKKGNKLWQKGMKMEFYFPVFLSCHRKQQQGKVYQYLSLL